MLEALIVGAKFCKALHEVKNSDEFFFTFEM